MKAIILAAGMGTRLGNHTENIPKAMLPVRGEALIQRQMAILRRVGLEDIVVVTGYKKGAIDFPGVRYYHNPDYAATNMVESLMCARPEFNTDILVLYSDILFTPEHLRTIAAITEDFAVLVDKNWREYWKMRYGAVEHDMESLEINEDGEIIDIGRPAEHSLQIDYRYVGINKFSRKGIKEMLALYDRKAGQASAWSQSGKEFRQGYLTDLIQEIIIDGNKVKAVVIENGWLEFDTTNDYEQIELEDGGNSRIAEVFDSVNTDDMKTVHQILNHSYADYSSSLYLNRHLESRKSFLRNFQKERLDLKEKLLGNISTDAQVICKVCSENLLLRQGHDGFDTFGFLLNTLTHYCTKGAFSQENLNTLNVLQKKFAVFHRIFSRYDNDMHKMDSSFQATEVYALFSILCTIKFHETFTYNDFNTTLCVNDLLTGTTWLIKPAYRDLIYSSVALELNTISILYNEQTS